MACRTVSFEVVGIAQPKGSTKAFMPKGARFPIVTSDNPRVKDWQHAIAAQAQTVGAGALFAGGVTLAVAFFLPRPVSLPRRVVAHVRRPDLDKLIRAVSDALIGILYHDDSQVCEIRASKQYAIGIDAPRVLVTLEGTATAARPTLFSEDMHP